MVGANNTVTHRMSDAPTVIVRTFKKFLPSLRNLSIFKDYIYTTIKQTKAKDLQI